MTTTVAVINWNSGERLRACVESVLTTTTNVDVLVVDNASDDSSVESLKSLRNRVTLIRNSVNRGFAGGINQAFGSSGTSYVLVLNPDVRVTAGAVGILEEFLEKHQRAGVAGGYLNEKYLPKGFPSVGKLVKENLGLRKIAGGQRPPLQSAQPIACEQPAAAALMIRREAFESVGGFDEQFYPAWYEDVDFCRRLKTAGWDIYFAPKAEFIHEGGYSASTLGPESFARAYYSNQLRYARKHLGAVGSAAVRASIAVGMIGRIIGRPKQAAAYAKVLIGVLGGW